MNTNIRDTASNVAAKLKVYTVFLVRYIVFIGRKYPLIAALFLLFYAFFFLKSLNISSSRNLPLPSTPSYSNNQPITPTPTPTPVIEAAQATAIKNGSNLTIQFTKPVENPMISANGKRLDFKCQAKTCDVILSQPLSQINLSWWQQGKRFTKDFRF